jgi:hypothetical protein
MAKAKPIIIQGWVVVIEGFVCLDSLKFTEVGSKKAFFKNRNLPIEAWNKYRKEGYRCVPASLKVEV